MKMTKKELGAFYTTNSARILKGFEHLVADKHIIDPCCGAGDLLNWATINGAASVVGMDINADTVADKVQDTICNVPDYTGLMIVTNPPYLGRNKSDNKEPFEMWGVNDLYKAAIRSYMAAGVEEGILIVPSNIFVDEDYTFRKELFSTYSIENVVMFEEQMFDDTPVKVTAFYFRKGKTTTLMGHSLVDTKEGKLRVGKDWFNTLDDTKKGISRLLADQEPTSQLNMVRVMDSGTEQGKITMSYGDEAFYGKSTDRNFCTISFDANVWGVVTEEEQITIMRSFNRELNAYRKKYNSMFLTNGQASAGRERKRIGFDTVYKFISLKLKEIRE